MPLKSILAISFLAVTGLGANPSALPTFKQTPDDFFYSQQTSLWLFYKVPKALIRQNVGDTLDRLGFELASFEDPDAGYVILKPMVFTAEFGFQRAGVPGTSGSTEVELTVLVYSKGQEPRNRSTFESFIKGKDPAREIGQLRLDVLCDNEVAVSAGRMKFGEHKFLGSFEYDYPTPNNTVGKAKPFSLNMTAYTWKGAGVSDKKMFNLKVDLAKQAEVVSVFSPELLHSAFPPEPSPTVNQTPVGEFRYYDNRQFTAYLPGKEKLSVALELGNAAGAEPLRPAPPFGNAQPISGSEKWPADMVSRMKNLLVVGEVSGALLYQTPPAEYETKPFKLKR